MFQAEKQALLAAHKSLGASHFATIEDAQEAVYDEVASSVEKIEEAPAVRIETDHQGNGARMIIMVDPTDEEGDIFAFAYVGQKVGGVNWSFAYDGPVEMSDKQSEG